MWEGVSGLLPRQKKRIEHFKYVDGLVSWQTKSIDHQKEKGVDSLGVPRWPVDCTGKQVSSIEREGVAS